MQTPIEVKMSVLDTGKQIMQEYLKKTNVGYKLVLREEGYDDADIKVPFGATKMVELILFKEGYRFFKVSNKGLYKWSSYLEYWELLNCKTISENLGGHDILWEREIQDSSQEVLAIQDNISKQHREVLKYFEMYLKGVDIQFKLDNSTEPQWYNMTDSSMNAFKHPNVQLREKPRYVTLDGITFKTAHDLLVYLKKEYNIDPCVF